ncbi:MAG: helix-turn-helix transcriptional regulator, partial [Bacillota bacterium]|nr:helix-turn-helix transcriptional regulator [Bacillota bacterium]
MNTLNIGENILKLRRQRGLTQEELAEHMGVTKASVSKWETKQSLPDILLLPQLAGFFDVSVDDILGYAPQLSPEQIKKHYIALADDFATLPFEEAMEKSRTLLRSYYSCYSLVFHIALLWLNHFKMAPTEERQRDVLKMAQENCEHIINNCRDVSLCRNAIALKATLDLENNRIREAIACLEELTDPYSLERQSDILLIQGYQI